MQKGETSSPAPALYVLRGRGRSITMHIWSAISRCHVRPACWRLGCNLTGPRNIPVPVALCTPTVDLLLIYACIARVHGFELRLGKSARSACRRSARRGQILFRRGYSCRWGSWQTRQSSKSIFSALTTFHVTVNG